MHVFVLSRERERKKNKGKDVKMKIVNIKVFNKSNKYLKFFNPFEKSVSEREFSDNRQKYDYFFNLCDDWKSIPCYFKINHILNILMCEFYLAYEKRNYARKYGEAENLFNFVLSCVCKLEPNVKGLSEQDSFDYVRQNLDYWSIFEYISQARINLFVKKKDSDFFNHQECFSISNETTLQAFMNVASQLYTYRKYKFGLFLNKERWGLIDNNIVYCCLGFVLIDKFLEDIYDNVDLLLDLFEIVEKLTSGIDYRMLQKEINEEISKRMSESASQRNKKFRDHYKQKQKEAFDKNPNLTANSFALSFCENPTMEIPYVKTNQLNQLIKLAQENNKEFKKAKASIG